jgi:tol-pal system protein YbgF
MTSTPLRNPPLNPYALFRFGLMAACALAIAAPQNTYAQSSDTSQLMNRLDRVERDLKELRGQVYRGGATGSGQASAPIGGTGGEYPLLRIDQLEEELRRLTGKLEEIQFAQDQQSSRLERLSNDIDFRLKALEGGKTPAAPAQTAGPTAAPPVNQPAGPAAIPGDPFRSPPAGNLGSMPAGQPSVLPPAAAPAPPAAQTALPGGTPEEQYNYAFGLVRQGDLASAEIALKEFIAKNPKHERAGNADYWLGETYYARGNYQAAATAYLDTVQTYGTGPKGPDALLKLGMSLGLLQQKGEACQILKSLPAKFPKAEAPLKDRAKLEMQRLKCS